MEISDSFFQNEQVIDRGMLTFYILLKKVWSSYTASVRFRTRSNPSIKRLEYPGKFDTPEEVLDDLNYVFLPSSEKEYLHVLANYMDICTFGEYCERFFNRIVFHFDWDTKERSTAYQYERTAINQLSHAFGTVRFIDINQEVCDEAFKKLRIDYIARRENRLAATIPEERQESSFADRRRTFENILFSIFNYAVDIAQHRQRKNPIKKVALSRRLSMLTRSVRNERLRTKSMECAEWSFLFDFCVERLKRPEKDLGNYIGFIIMLCIPFRPAEVCGLRFKDIISLEFTNDYAFRVYAQASKEKHTLCEYTLKTQNAYHLAPIPHILAKYLLEYRAYIESMIPETSQSMRKIDEICILSYLDQNLSPIPPRDFSKFAADVFKKVGITSSIALSSPAIDEELETLDDPNNITVYYLRRNCCTYYKTLACLSDTELTYVMEHSLLSLGVAQNSHQDFNNDLALHNIILKLDRMYSVWLKPIAKKSQPPVKMSKEPINFKDISSVSFKANVQPGQQFSLDVQANEVNDPIVLQIASTSEFSCQTVSSTVLSPSLSPSVLFEPTEECAIRFKEKYKKLSSDLKKSEASSAKSKKKATVESGVMDDLGNANIITEEFPRGRNAKIANITESNALKVRTQKEKQTARCNASIPLFPLRKLNTGRESDKYHCDMYCLILTSQDRYAIIKVDTPTLSSTLQMLDLASGEIPIQIKTFHLDDMILLISSNGIGYYFAADTLFAKATDRDPFCTPLVPQTLSSNVVLKKDDHITAFTVLDAVSFKYSEDYFLYFITAGGMINKINVVDKLACFLRTSRSQSSRTLINLRDGDIVVSAFIAIKADNLLTSTSHGRALTVLGAEIPLRQNTNCIGVIGIKAREDQSCLGAIPVQQDSTMQIISITQNGFAKRSAVVEYYRNYHKFVSGQQSAADTHSRNAKGLIAHRIQNSPLVGLAAIHVNKSVASAPCSEYLFVLNTAGQSWVIPAEKLPEHKRYHAGLQCLPDNLLPISCFCVIPVFGGLDAVTESHISNTHDEVHSTDASQ